MRDSFLIESAQRYDIKGKAYIETPKKSERTRGRTRTRSGETTERNFIYDDNGQLIKCTESRGSLTRPPILMSMTRPGTAPSQRKRSFTAIWSPGRSEINGVKYSDIDYINRILKVE